MTLPVAIALALLLIVWACARIPEKRPLVEANRALRRRR